MANLRLQREQVLQSLKRDSNSAKRRAAPSLQALLVHKWSRPCSATDASIQCAVFPASVRPNSLALRRAALLEPAATGGGSSAPGRETLRTAELDNRGLVQLQQTVMREQDAELEELERSVTSTKVRSGRAGVSTWQSVLAFDI